MSQFRNAMLALLAAATIAGCARSAAQMAATQPEAVDMSVLNKGTHCDKVIARLGAPESSSRHGAMTADVYKFRQGFSALNRTARVFTHSTLSIATLGLWEVTGTAIEGYARGTIVSVRVVYNENDQLESFEILDGHDALDEEVVKASHKGTAPAPVTGREVMDAKAQVGERTRLAQPSIPEPGPEVAFIAR